MLGLGQRIRSYFPTLLGEDYFPNRYNIVTSQVLFDQSFNGVCTLHDFSKHSIYACKRNLSMLSCFIGCIFKLYARSRRFSCMRLWLFGECWC